MRNERIRDRAPRVDEIAREVQDRYGHMMRRALRRKNDDGNVSTREAEERKA